MIYVNPNLHHIHKISWFYLIAFINYNETKNCELHIFILNGFVTWDHIIQLSSSSQKYNVECAVAFPIIILCVFLQLVFTGKGGMAGKRARKTLFNLGGSVATSYQANGSTSPMDEEKQSKIKKITLCYQLQPLFGQSMSEQECSILIFEDFFILL